MPELPEAETIARQLSDRLSGKRISTVGVLRPDVIHGEPMPLDQLIAGQRVSRVHRRAKRIVFTFARGTRAKILVFHLGMSGRLFTCSPAASIEKHTHLRIGFEKVDLELRFRDPRRFGGVWCLRGSKDGEDCTPRLGPLGPEPLELGIAKFRTLLTRRRQVKALLLDQRAIAGLGNIYTDEALFAAGIHPLQQADTLTPEQSDALLRAIKRTLRKAIRCKGSTLISYRTADGTPGSFQNHHRVYSRTGKPCRLCGVPIEHLRVAGRSTFICPNCQM